MEKMLLWEGEPAAVYTLELPRIPEEGRFERIAAYYQKLGEACTARWEGELYQRAAGALLAARERSKPFEPFQMAVSAFVTYFQDDLWSLYLDITEKTDDLRPYVFRQGDTWDMKTGAPCRLEDFYPPETKWKKQVSDEVVRQVGERIASGESLLDPDALAKAARAIDFRRFHLTEEGICLFYPIDVLGPFAEGIPVFLVKKSCARGENGI